MTRPPTWPSVSLLSDLAFATCGFLLDFGLSGRMLIERLRSMEWHPQSGKSAEYRVLRNFEGQGLINSVPGSNEIFYELTSLGYESWIATLNYRKAAVEFWDPAKPKKRPRRFPDPAPRSIPAVIERAPTDTEQELLLKKARSEFRAVYAFAMASGARPMDLLNARIEALDVNERVLILEKTSVTGRRIENRRIEFDRKALPIVTTATGERETGVIFLGPKAQPWSYDNFSSTFRRIRKACGISDEVVLSGRGGRVAGEIQSKNSK